MAMATSQIGRKKIYAHYEGKYSSEEITRILWIDEQTTIKTFLKTFVKEVGFNKANPNTFAIVLSCGDVLEESGSIYDKFENKDDCFVQDLILTENSVSSSLTHPAAEEKTQQTSPSISTLTEIDKLIKNLQYRKARTICEDALKRSPNDFPLLERLTLILYSSKQFQEASIVGERALKAEPKNSSHEIYLLVGRISMENQDHEEALSIFRRGIDLFEKRPSTTKEGKTLYLNLKAESCRALFLLGRHPEAGNLINDLMTSPNPYGADPQNDVTSLLMYAEIAAQYDKIPEALQAALKAVVSDQSNKRAKKLLATILSHPTGVDELYKQVPPTAVASSAYAFVAMGIKDHSALGPAERIFKRIIEIERGNLVRKSTLSSDIHNHVLNLIHVLETAAQPLAALSETANHLRFLMTTPEGGPLGLQDILDELDSAIGLVAVSSQTRSPTLFFPPILSTGTPPLRLLWYRDPDTREESPHLVPLDSSSEEIVPMSEQPLQIAPPLDLLAILFTTIKILFVQGNLASVTRLVEKIELLRRSYQTIHKTAIHTTTIRNEHAFFLCICQVLSVVQSRSSSLPTFPYYESFYFNHNRPIFLFGDSHCLSAAWSQITVPSDLSNPQSPLQSRLLIPKLVTGLKQWHLRPESDFYPKEGFQRMVASLPEGSDVILLVGEIDCREGLLVAVERGIYSSIEEAMVSTLKIFRSTITNLILKKKFRVFIHPVIPVLDLTRQIVSVFNFHYQRMVSDIRGCYWLNIYESFLTSSTQPENLVLREEWKLDGTHLNPAYASLLEEGLKTISRG